MNWLRKIGNWLWLNKERMVLAVMVSILVFRVYQVLNPGPITSDRNLGPPKDTFSEDSERPGLPPPAPALPQTDDWSRLWRVSLFTYRQPRGAGSNPDGPEDTENQLDVRLLKIQDAGADGLRARIQTERAGWYKVGDKFESYELLSINPETNCVSIFAEEKQSRLDICVEE